MTTSPPSASWPAAIATLLLLTCAGYHAVTTIHSPPAPIPASAPPAAFSAERAFVHVQECAQRPHPIGSEENARIRDYLVQTLQSYGYETALQEDYLFSGDSNLRFPQNIYARLKGNNSTGAVMLMAHYDSVPFGPGAADDITGVSTIVETARALKSGPPLRNDVIFLLTDGEEAGLLGAKAFLQSHPWRADVKCVFNFEARGHYGPSMMFHTHPENGGVIKEFIKAVPYPVSSSMMFDVAGRMPTTTDYWAFKREGIPGLDFAFVGGLKYYHTMNDSPENLSKATLQHHGSYALSLSRHFGALDLNTVAWQAEPVIYFNTLGHHIVAYPQAWIWPLTLATIGVVLLSIAVGLFRARITPRGLLAGALWLLLPLVLVPIAVALPIILGFRHFGLYAIYNQPWYVAGLCFLTLGIFSAVYARASQKNTPESLAAGALLWWAAASVATALYFPLGTYLTTWPTIFAALGLLALCLVPARAIMARTLIAILAALPAVVLNSPSLFSFFDTVTFTLAPGILLLAALCLGLVLPALITALGPDRWALPLLSVVIATPLLAWAILNTTIDPSRPQMNSLDYGADYSTGEACFISADRTTDEYTKIFFATAAQAGNFDHFNIEDRRTLRKAPAMLAAPSGARIDVLEDTTSDTSRTVKLLVHPGPNTSEFFVFTPPSLRVDHAEVLGREYGRKGGMTFASWLLNYRGRCDAGLPVTLTIPADGDLAVTLIEVRYGLPDIPDSPVPARPPYMIPEPNTTPTWDFSWAAIRSGNALKFHGSWNSNRAFLRKTFTFAQSTDGGA